MTQSDLTWCDLGNPRPKARISTYTPIAWPQGIVTRLAKEGRQSAPQLASVMASRRSRREFAEPAAYEDLATLFDLCCRTQSTSPSGMGFDLEFRPYPASGAIHSIHILIQRAAGEDWCRYNPNDHALVTLPQSAPAADAARHQASEVVDASNATLIALVAEHGKVAAKYEFPESLVWRDAGVLLGYLSLGAHALGLAFCPLGISGDPHFYADTLNQGHLRGVGVALLGRLPLG
jgi:hypothetical protein